MEERVVFAKLFETSSGQVLVTKDYDEDAESRYFMNVRIDPIQGFQAELKNAYSDESVRDYQFDNFDQSKAEDFEAVVLKQM